MRHASRSLCERCIASAHSSSRATTRAMCFRRLSLTCAQDGSSSSLLSVADVSLAIRADNSAQLRELALPEVPIEQLAMRNMEVGIVQGLLLIGDDVEVERARPPSHVATPALAALDLEEMGQQLSRREL